MTSRTASNGLYEVPLRGLPRAREHEPSAAQATDEELARWCWAAAAAGVRLHELVRDTMNLM